MTMPPEASPNQNTIPMNEKIDVALASIDRMLEEYDAQVEHRRIDHELSIGLVATHPEVELLEN